MKRNYIDTGFPEIRIAELRSLSRHDAGEIRFSLANCHSLLQSADEAKEVNRATLGTQWVDIGSKGNRELGLWIWHCEILRRDSDYLITLAIQDQRLAGDL